MRFKLEGDQLFKYYRNYFGLVQVLDFIVHHGVELLVGLNHWDQWEETRLFEDQEIDQPVQLAVLRTRAKVIVVVVEVSPF